MWTAARPHSRHAKRIHVLVLDRRPDLGRSGDARGALSSGVLSFFGRAVADRMPHAGGTCAFSSATAPARAAVRYRWCRCRLGTYARVNCGRPFLIPSPNSRPETHCVPGGFVEGRIVGSRGHCAISAVGRHFSTAKRWRAIGGGGTPGVLVRAVTFRRARKAGRSALARRHLHVKPGLFRPGATYLTLLRLARRHAP